MRKRKEVLTTGDVAKICNVAPRTVSKWFDSGQLRGYRIPGSKDRRIPLQQLVRFMRAHGMPLNGVETGQVRVLIVERETEFVGVLQRTLADEADYDVQVAHGGFEAGAVAQSFRPHVMLIDISLSDVDPRQICRHVRSSADLQNTRIIAVGTGLDEAQGQALCQSGFDGYLSKPFEIRQVVQAIEQAASVVTE